ncbi:MAG: hypothetical protein M3Y28_09715 [Armatimonadota bacterium]|nr:hypothetical protein [Armatimonadota bacterium]
MRNRSLKSLLLCGALLTGAACFQTASEPVGLAQGYLAPTGDKNTALVQAAGEFRIVAANILWAKVVDHYHHQYMADGGDWSKNASLLPLLQTIIALDPHFAEAYELMGGTILPRLGRIEEGQAVLARGLKNNPDDWEMYREIAMLYAWTQHRPQDALPYAEKGLTQADDDFSRQLMSRLCQTLHRQLRDKAQAAKHDTALNGLPGRPGPAKTTRQSRPSA